MRWGVAFGCNIDRMTLRHGLLALSLVAVAAATAASLSPIAAQTPPAPSAPQSSSTPAPASAPAAAPAPDAAAPGDIAVDPLAIAFDVSLDHDATDAAGQKLLKYVIDFVPTAGPQARTYMLDLGKPKPVEGVISVPLTKVLLPGTYVAHVRAVGRDLQAATVTVGPFQITEKIAKTQADVYREVLALDHTPDRRTKKPNAKAQDAKAPNATPPEKPAQAQPPPQHDKGKDGAKPANGKGGFWKKFYEKVVG